MTTVINNPGEGNGSGSAAGMIFGIIVLLVIVGLFFVYGLPAIRGGSAAPLQAGVNVNVTAPSGGASTPAPSTP